MFYLCKHALSDFTSPKYFRKKKNAQHHSVVQFFQQLRDNCSNVGNIASKTFLLIINRQQVNELVFAQGYQYNLFRINETVDEMKKGIG